MANIKHEQNFISLNKIIHGIKALPVVFILISLFCKETLSSWGDVKEIEINSEVKIVIPSAENFDTKKLYSGIEIWIKGKKVYRDTSSNEYVFGDKLWPRARKLKSGSYEIILHLFDAPDFDKLKVLYIKDNQVIASKNIPFFENSHKDDKGIFYSGILNVVDAYSSKQDSCFYNPMLYYRETEAGITIDSLMTKVMNEQYWGRFYGFELDEKIILPYPKTNK
jgi:hypothetical protein